jgi:hypothetical protein
VVRSLDVCVRASRLDRMPEVKVTSDIATTLLVYRPYWRALALLLL